MRAIADEIHVRLIRDEADTDEEIAPRIAYVLDWNIAIPDHNIIAEVSDGHVKLTGDVDAAFEKEVIEDAVWSATGVTEVFNHLRGG